GTVRLHVYDPERLGGALSGFAPLGKAGLLSFIGPSGLREALDALVEDVRRVNADVLAGDHASLADLATATGRRPEPWRVLVLIDSGIAAWPAHERAQLARLRRTGVGAGVHLVIVDDEADDDLDGLPRLTAAAYTGLPGAPIRLDPAPPSRTVTAAAKTLAEKHSAGREPARLIALLPDRLWAASSAAGLDVAFGERPTGDPARVVLGDNPPHALVGGPSGSGKTNLLYAWIAALASTYHPDELALHLLDFQEGVSFARFAAGRKDPTWLLRAPPRRARAPPPGLQSGRLLRPLRRRPQGPLLAPARPPRRRQHQRRPRVRARAPASPQSRAAPPRRGRQGTRGHRTRRAPRSRPGRALAPDRRHRGRVPGPPRDRKST